MASEWLACNAAPAGLVMPVAFYIAVSRAACALRWLVVLGACGAALVITQIVSDPRLLWIWLIGTWIVAALAAYVLIHFSLKASHVVGRMRQNSVENEARRCLETGAPYFLFLRSFAFDTSIRVIDDNRVTLELTCGSRISRTPVQYHLAIGLRPIAPMLGIGRPTLAFGMPSIDSSHADWKGKFLRIAEGAVGIFVLPSLTKGSEWELACIFADALERTLFVVPPTHAVPKHADEFWDHYTDFILRFCGEEALNAPAFRSYDGGLFHLRATGSDEIPFVPDQSWPLTAKGVSDAGAWLMSQRAAHATT
jgi:hypothetical protein